jgi:hypothetical protein
MDTTFTINEDVSIIVEFASVPGLKQTSILPEDVTQKSAEALASAMGAIYQMARRTQAVIRALPVSERPHEMEVDFNLKLTATGGVVLAKAGVESTLNVKLKWKRDEVGHDRSA